MGEPSTDRLGLLLDQLDRARQLAQARLEGLASPPSLPTGTPLGPRRGSGRLSDEEYLWEPASGAWSIRRRDQAATPRAFGPGEWVLDNDTGDPDPAPVTTNRLAAGAPALQLRGSLRVDLRRAAAAAGAAGRLHPLRRGGP
jgi:hypothetical protein